MIDLAGSLEDQRAGQRRETSHGPMCKTVADLERYRRVIRATRPSLLIETGTWTGASAHWFGFEMVQGGQPEPLVVTIDTQEAPELRLFHTSEEGYAICPLVGDSEGPHIRELVREMVRALEGQARVMVVLDSDHSAAHVRQELELYAPFVTPGCYLVVEDTITRYMEGTAGFAGSPADALDAWLPLNPMFERDTELEDALERTQHPGGWLRRWTR